MREEVGQLVDSSLLYYEVQQEQSAADTNGSLKIILMFTILNTVLVPGNRYTVLVQNRSRHLRQIYSEYEVL
jgi:hypothetical protein